MPRQESDADADPSRAALATVVQARRKAPPASRQQRLFVALLLVGHLGFYPLAAGLMDVWPDLAWLSFAAAKSIQISFCLVWAVLGPGRLAWRLPLALLLIFGLSFLIGMPADLGWNPFGERFETILFQIFLPAELHGASRQALSSWRMYAELIAVINAPLLTAVVIARSAGYRIVRTADDVSAGAGRFSLRSLMIGLTAAAAAAASARPFRRWMKAAEESIPRLASQAPDAWLIGAALSLGVMAGLGIWLRPGSPLARLGHWMLIGCGVWSYIAYILSASGPLWKASLIWVLLSFVTWGVLRLAGYRLLSWKERRLAFGIVKNGS